MFCNSKQQTDLWSNLDSFQPHIKLYLHCCVYFYHFPKISIRAVLAQIRSLACTICPQHWSQIGTGTGNREKPETARLGDKSVSLTQQILIGQHTHSDFVKYFLQQENIFIRNLEIRANQAEACGLDK